MPRKPGGEFKPTIRQARLGAEEIVFSKPYRLKGSNNYVVDVYMSSPTGYNVIKGKSYGVAKRLAYNYKKEVAHVQSRERMEFVTERYLKEMFSSDVARSGILMENLSKEGGLNDIMKAGLKGRLSPKNQKIFDNLSLMINQISKDPNLANEFYKEAKEMFTIIGDKYKLFQRSGWAITDEEDYDPKDKRRSATRKDVEELERALEDLSDLASKYYLERVERINTGKQQIDMTDEIIMRNMKNTSLEFQEGYNKLKGRMKIRKTKW